MQQIGKTEEQRRDYLQQVDNLAIHMSFTAPVASNSLVKLTSKGRELFVTQ